MKKRARLLVTVLALFLVTAAYARISIADDYDNGLLNAQLNASTRPDHVTLTWSDDPRVSMTITWRTSDEIKRCLLEYREAGDDSPVTVEAMPETFTTVSGDPHHGKMHIFSVALKELKPGITYLYRIGSDRHEWTGTSSFTTESLKTVQDNKFKFLVFGDSQSGSEKPDYKPWHETVQRAFAGNGDARFFINMGDLVEIGQSYLHWQNWFSSVQGVIDRIPEVAVEGNHETYVCKDPACGQYWKTSMEPLYFKEQFRLFANGPRGMEGRAYSFNYGKVHFVVLDSQAEEEVPHLADGEPDMKEVQAFFDRQTEWLKKDLGHNRGSLFTLVFFHKTPYYNKGNRTNLMLKKTFCPIFDDYHVDVVFNGHDHATARTFPMRDDRFVQSPSEGTVYYVTGRSGAKYYGDLAPKIWDARFYDPQEQPDYQTVELDGGRLTIKAFSQGGSTLDEYVIDKDHPENSTSMREPLPARYRSEKNPKLILFGSMPLGGKSRAVLDNGKAYADILSIFLAVDGEYQADKREIIFPKGKIYKFPAADLRENGTMVSADYLKGMGWSNHYDPVYNILFIER